MVLPFLLAATGWWVDPPRRQPKTFKPVPDQELARLIDNKVVIIGEGLIVDQSVEYFFKNHTVPRGTMGAGWTAYRVHGSAICQYSAIRERCQSVRQGDNGRIYYIRSWGNKPYPIMMTVVEKAKLDSYHVTTKKLGELRRRTKTTIVHGG